MVDAVSLTVFGSAFLLVAFLAYEVGRRKGYRRGEDYGYQHGLTTGRNIAVQELRPHRDSHGRFSK